MVRRQLAFFLATTMMLPAAGVPAKDKKPERPRPIGGLTFLDETDVMVVNVEVYVRDKQGQPVAGLTAEDFVVEQDGVRMPISNFALMNRDVIRRAMAARAPSIPGLPPTAAAVEAEPLPEDLPEVRPTYLVVYVDNENLRPLDRNRVLRQARDFIAENLQPPVHMMVVSYQRSLKVLQPFTQDPGEVLSALRDVRLYTGGRPERDSARREVIEMIQEESERQQEGRGRGTMRSQAYHMAHSFAEEETNNLMFSLGALRQVIDMVAGLPGRKAILYVSNGLSMTPGADLFFEYANVFQDNSAITAISRYERGRDFESLTAAANAQGVTFYTVGAGGLEVTSGISAETRYAPNPESRSIASNNYEDSMRFLARETGGLAIIRTNDVTAGLERVEDDLFTYYSLGYTINPTGSDRVHRVKVEIPGQPDYDLRYRERFVEKSLESRIADRVMTSLVMDVTDNPMGVDIELGIPAPATSDRWTVPLEVEVPLDSVALLPEGDDYVGRVVLFVAARDDDGKQSDLQRQEHDIRVPAAEYEQARARPFTIGAGLLMEAGSYRVSVGVMDQVTRQATFATDSIVVRK